ncbi:hypothetical protein FACS189490_11090 [Clostridia bacterium]|nr:hypothetical protein FACS189490_11090 [Clostridia bacterium]
MMSTVQENPKLLGYLEKSKKFVLRGDYPEAFSVLKKALKITNNNEHKLVVIQGLVKCMAEIGKIEPLRYYLEMLVEYDCSFENAQGLVDLYVKLENETKFDKLEEKVAQIEIKDDEDKVKLIAFLTSIKKYEKADVLADEILNEDICPDSFAVPALELYKKTKTPKNL